MHKENQLVETNKTVNLLNVEDLVTVKAPSWPNFVYSFSYFLNPSLRSNLDNSTNWGAQWKNFTSHFCISNGQLRSARDVSFVEFTPNFFMFRKIRIFIMLKETFMVLWSVLSTWASRQFASLISR